MGYFNLNVRMSVAANAAMLIVIVLLLALAQPVQAYKVQASELPNSVPLDKETTIRVQIDLEGAQSIRIEKIEAIISNPGEGIIASGMFDANGTIIDDGGFIVSVGLTSGTINQSWGYDSTTGIVYSIKILLKSSDFKASEGNEFTVIVYRGLLFNPLRSDSVIFNITEANPWPIVIAGVAVVEVCIFLVTYSLFFRKRTKVRKRKSRQN